MKYTGVGVAIITPFSQDLSVDFAALANVLDYVIKGGVHYIVTLGTTGETATLTEAEKIEILEFTYIHVNGRVPVVVGIGGNNTQEVINTIHSWPLQQAAAILSVSPCYNKPSQQGIYQHYAAIAQCTDKPIILYNVPGRTSSNIHAETTIQLATNFKNIAGIKEASGNMIQCMHLAKNRPEGFVLLSGDDHLALPLIALGFDGVISVAANCFAPDFCTLINAAFGGNYSLANTLQHKLLTGMDLLFAENNPAGAKAFLAEMALIENYLRLPLVPLSSELHQHVKAYLTK